jgi:hypothetical protein
MSDRPSKYSLEETARIGDEIYDRDIRAQLEPSHNGKVVAIDIESGGFALAENALDASKQVRAEHPGAEIWCRRVGERALHKMRSPRLRSAR